VGYFDKTGEYNYTIKETTPDGGGYTTDKNTYPYKVVVTDNGQGQLVANITQPTPEPVFENKYTSAGSESILAFKSLQGWDNGKTAPNFNFSLKDKDGKVIKQLQSNGGTLDFGVLQFTEPGDYEYTVNEDTPLPNGWSIPTRSYRVIVHMEDDGHGKLIASVAYPDSNNTSPQFVNTYSTTPANVGGVISNNPSGENPTKSVIGGDKVLKDSQFRFGLFDKNGNLVALGFNRANGRINFPLFFVSNLGESDYTMKELTPDGNGWTTDKTNYPVKVNITDNGQGQRTATITYPNGTPAFKNNYTAENSNVNITGKVNGDKKQPTDGEFEFDVVDNNGNVVGKAHNDGNGNIVFPPLNLPEGDHDFKIIPPPNGNGWTFNVPDLPVHIHVSDNGDGTTTPKITYPDGNIFNPDYNPTPANVGNIIANNPSGQNPTKIATDAPLSNHQFTFGLYDEYNKLVAVGYNTADGKIEFPNFLMTTLGNTQYTMKEVTVDGNGWMTDKTAYPVNINITDNGNGVLNADVTYPNGTPIFKNTYNYTPISQQITANKILHNWKGNDKHFNFYLKNQDGEIIKTAQNIDGLIDFGEINYNEPGTYKYTIEEENSPGAGWKTDTNIFSVVVTVIRDSSGKLVSSVEYPIGTPIFNNYYTSSNALISIYGRKTAVGKNIEISQFDFELDDSNGNKISTTKNEADGYISFPEFNLPPGNYDFTMKETTPDGNSWTTDKRTIPIHIKVVDNGDGTSYAEVTYPNGNEFVNVYKPEPVEVTVNAKKCVCGCGVCLGENMFCFGLYDNDDVEISTAKNDGNGNISFLNLSFNEPGTYHYTIREISKSGCGWKCDNRTFGITITVTDMNGKLSAVVNYDGGEVPCFVNYYNSCCNPRC
jgi:pilin isopeptide linkage protein